MTDNIKDHINVHQCTRIVVIGDCTRKLRYSQPIKIYCLKYHRHQYNPRIKRKRATMLPLRTCSILSHCLSNMVALLTGRIRWRQYSQFAQDGCFAHSSHKVASLLTDSTRRQFYSQFAQDCGFAYR